MIAGDIETVFLFTDDQSALISGTLVRQIAEMGGLEGGQISRLIPDSVVERLRAKAAG